MLNCPYGLIRWVYSNDIDYIEIELLIMMSHQPNFEAKYQKALVQIANLQAANLTLRDDAFRNRTQLEIKLNEALLRQDSALRTTDIFKAERDTAKSTAAEFIEEANRLRQEINNLTQQKTALHETIADLKVSARKMTHAVKHENLISLLNNYEEREESLRRDFNTQQDNIQKLKTNISSLEEELAAEGAAKYKMEALVNQHQLDINRLQQLNSALLQREQQHAEQRDVRTAEKQRQVFGLVDQLNKTMEAMTTYSSPKASSGQNQSSQVHSAMESLKRDRMELEVANVRLRGNITDLQNKVSMLLTAEEKCTTLEHRLVTATDQANRLKSRIILLESRELAEQPQLEEDGDVGDLENKLNLLASEANTPLMALKNTDDTSHFRILITFIKELQQKVTRLQKDKKDIAARYNNFKLKFIKKYEEVKAQEEQNILLRGKLASTEIIAEKLRLELENTITVNQIESAKMNVIQSSLINRKAEEAKIIQATLRTEFDIELEKVRFEKVQLQQALEFLRSDFAIVKAKLQECQFALYETKSLTAKRQGQQAHDEEVGAAAVMQKDNSLKFEELYLQEKVRAEAAIADRESFCSKFTIGRQQLQQILFAVEAALKNKQSELEERGRLYRMELTQKNQLIEELSAVAELHLRDKSGLSSSASSSQGELNQLRNQADTLRRTTSVQIAELNALRIENDRLRQEVSELGNVRKAVSQKGNEVSDLNRRLLWLEKEVKQSELVNQERQRKEQNLNSELTQLKQQREILKQSISLSQAEVIQAHRKEMNLIQKEVSEADFRTQSVNRQLAKANSEVANMKAQQNRLQTTVAKFTRQIQDLKEAYRLEKMDKEALNVERQTLKSELGTLHKKIVRLSAQMLEAREAAARISDQSNQLRRQYSALEASSDGLIRKIAAFKIYVPQLENIHQSILIRNSLSLEEQRQLIHLNDTTLQIKRLISETEQLGQGLKQSLNFPDGATGYDQNYHQALSPRQYSGVEGVFSRS